MNGDVDFIHGLQLAGMMKLILAKKLLDGRHLSAEIARSPNFLADLLL
jgi:hypothetical protein